jgi:ubiquinone/menaquinone biosynthesis C-methylase UbiE
MDAENLRSHLGELDKKTSAEQWYAGLNQRKREELHFHNRDRDKHLTENLPKDTFEVLHGNKKYYSTVATSSNYVENWLKTHVKGKTFLDYACGNGGQALKAARFGAALAIGLDISDVSIKNARAEAEKNDLTQKTYFIQGDCENTGLPSESVDVILCSGMLHHLDLTHAFPELKRILKPGGKILCVEALDYNPVIKLYRNRTPSMRTDWEKNHILSLKDLRYAKRFFAVEDVKYWHFTSVAAAFIKNESVKEKVLKVLNGIDNVIAKIPIVNLMAWQFTFVLRKNE